MYPGAPTGQYYMQPSNGYDQQQSGMISQGPYGNSGMMHGYHQATGYNDQNLNELRSRTMTH